MQSAFATVCRTRWIIERRSAQCVSAVEKEAFPGQTVAARLGRGLIMDFSVIPDVRRARKSLIFGPRALRSGIHSRTGPRVHHGSRITDFSFQIKGLEKSRVRDDSVNEYRT